MTKSSRAIILGFLITATSRCLAADLQAALDAGRVAYKGRDYTTALKVCGDGLAQAEKSRKLRRFQGLFQRCIANTHSLQGKLDESLSDYSSALEIFRKIGDHLEEAKTEMDIGNTHITMHEYASAIDYENDALNILSKLDKAETYQRAVFCNLGKAYYYDRQYRHAVEAFQSAESLAGTGRNQGETAAALAINDAATLANLAVRLDAQCMPTAPDLFQVP